jgi:hypothetical protein
MSVYDGTCKLGEIVDGGKYVLAWKITDDQRCISLGSYPTRREAMRAASDSHNPSPPPPEAA